jgi:hypothetical protein
VRSNTRRDGVNDGNQISHLLGDSTFSATASNFDNKPDLAEESPLLEEELEHDASGEWLGESRLLGEQLENDADSSWLALPACAESSAVQFCPALHSPFSRRRLLHPQNGLFTCICCESNSLKKVTPSRSASSPLMRSSRSASSRLIRSSRSAATRSRSAAARSRSASNR